MGGKNLKIGIVGLGPVGMILAVHFREAGCDVAVCDIIQEKLNLIRIDGIKLEGKIIRSARFDRIYSSVNALLQSDVNIIIFSVKANQDARIMKQIGTSANKDLNIVIAQNGIGAEKIFTSVFDESQILRMVVNFAGNLKTPNTVNVTFFNPPNYVASVNDTRQETAQQLTDALNSISMETKCVNSSVIKDKAWEKNILNSGLSALCAITKLTMKEAMTFPETIEIVKQAIVEGVEVAQAEGVKLKAHFMDFAMNYFGNAGHHYPSLAVDLMNKSETEIEFINQKIVEYGCKHNIRTDVNLSLTNLVKAITYKNRVL
ncbi:MAG: ketopantoate reductase family protein [Bacteroidia bacterium]|nr:ketopantoate reductase family protein [Bacteroidia bacterium]